MSVELENNWVSTVDPETGDTYYANTVTGETTWDFPADAGSPPELELPPDWTSAVDPDTGDTYYANTVTGETTWNHPLAIQAAEEEEEEQKLELSPEIKEQWKTLLTYVHEVTLIDAYEKAKKFAGIRKFAEMANRRRDAVAARKKAEAEQEALELQAANEDGVRPKKALTDLLMAEVPVADYYAIEEFADSNMKFERKGFFQRRTTADRLLNWKKEVIRTALLKMPTRELEVQAIQSFRNVTGFMGDRSSKKADHEHAWKLLNTCIQAPEQLRDEVYCQLLKQTTKNPGDDSRLQGWKLIGICAGGFAPSKEFLPYVLSYLQSHKSDPLVGNYAKYAMARLAKTVSLGPRKETPTIMEILAAKDMKPFYVRVYHLDGTYDSVPITAWVTPALLKQMICESRGIGDPSSFGIFEFTPNAEERALDPDERIGDLVAYWQRLFEEEKAKSESKKYRKDRKRALIKFHRIMFKVALYLETEEDDPAAHHEHYIQAVYDIISTRYPCGERDCVALAGLQLQVEHGDDGPGDELEAHIARYLPQRYAQGPRVAELVVEMRKAHAEHKGKSKEQCEREYLQYVKQWQVYGSSFFYVEPQMNPDLPDDVFIAINPKGVLIIHPDSKEVLATYPYSEIPTWGHSGSSFVLHIGNLLRQNKLYFTTEQGKEMNELIRAYVNYLVAS